MTLQELITILNEKIEILPPETPVVIEASGNQARSIMAIIEDDGQEVVISINDHGSHS